METNQEKRKEIPINLMDDFLDGFGKFSALFRSMNHFLRVIFIVF